MTAPARPSAVRQMSVTDAVSSAANHGDERSPFRPITAEERDRWHADREIRWLLNRASARGLHELRSTVDSLRGLEGRAS